MTLIKDSIDLYIVSVRFFIGWLTFVFFIFLLLRSVKDMEMEAADLVSERWNELPEDLQMKILSWLPVELLYRYRIVSKEWKDWLSSNDFLTRWCEAPINSKQPRLALCDRNPKMPCMSFCFHTRTWIKSCFTLSFLHDWIPQTCRIDLGIYCSRSEGGLCLVYPYIGRPLRVCNPYTQTFVEIPESSIDLFGECIVVDENNNWRWETAYKVVAVGYSPPDANGLERPAVDIYDPSQKQWNIAGYLPDDVTLAISNELLFCNGSFYCYWEMPGHDLPTGIVGFTVPTNGSAVGPIPIPVILVPFPEIVQNVDGDNDILFHPWMVTCGSRLLLITGKRMPVHVGQIDGEGEKEVMIILWELRNGEDRSVSLENSESWKWVEIARMPPLVCKEWMNKDPLDASCNAIGVGDHVCFISTPNNFEQPIEVLDYNLIDHAWNWLPSCQRNHHCVGEEGCTGGVYDGMAFQPRPYMKVE